MSEKVPVMDQNSVQLLEFDEESNPIIGQQLMTVRLPAELMWRMAFFCSQNKMQIPQ